MGDTAYKELQFFKEFSKNSFVEVKGDVMGKFGKISVNLVSISETGKTTGNINCFLSFEEVLWLQMLGDKGMLAKQKKASKLAAGEGGYPKAIWQSPLGGGRSKDGTLYARLLSIEPAMRGDGYVLKAVQGPGKEDSKGLITFVNIKGAQTIRVPLDQKKMYAMLFFMRSMIDGFVAHQFDIFVPYGEKSRDDILKESIVGEIKEMFKKLWLKLFPKAA